MRGIAFSLGILLLFAAPPAGAEIYRWKDREGKLHFSDTPPHVETEKISLFPNDGIKPLPREPKREKEQKKTAPSRKKKEEAKALGAEDYQINFSAGQRGDELAVSGRIGNGPECPSLKVSVRVQDGRGTRKTVTGIVSNVGYGRSDLLDARTRVAPSGSRNDWTITDIDVLCRQ
jgi:hypothetical protein